MSYVQLSDGGFPGGLPPWLVVPVLRSCQSPTWVWLVNYLHLNLHVRITGMHACQSNQTRLVCILCTGRGWGEDGASCPWNRPTYACQPPTVNHQPTHVQSSTTDSGNKQAHLVSTCHACMGVGWGALDPFSV